MLCFCMQTFDKQQFLYAKPAAMQYVNVPSPAKRVRGQRARRRGKAKWLVKVIWAAVDMTAG